MLLTDSAGEFCSEEFSQFLQANDVKATIVPAESHWQMGRGERHGAIIQGMLDKYQVDHAIRSDEDLREALSQCTMAKNSLSRHKGYSPEILVLGKSRHSPSCNSNEPNDPSEWLSENPDLFCQNLKRRESARKAFIIADHDQKLRRAWLRRSRPARQLYGPGGLGDVLATQQGKQPRPMAWAGQDCSHGRPECVVVNPLEPFVSMCPRTCETFILPGT